MNEHLSTRPAFSRMWDAWQEFWFKPRDPTLVCLMRVLVGMVTLYTFVVHGLTLQEFMGENAWFDLRLRTEMVKNRPITTPGSFTGGPTTASDSTPEAPANEQQAQWRDQYKGMWGVWPPSPHPTTKQEFEFANEFRKKYNFDFRYFGLPFPKTKQEHEILDNYVNMHRQAFPPPFPATKADVERIESFLRMHGNDPRRLYARGIPIFSVWLHVIDPFWMNVVQGFFVLAAVCFVLGLGTRVSAVVVWFANICYIHRDTWVLFGVDTMMCVLLMYLMIAPCGAVLSLDRVIKRRRLGAEPPIEPSVWANVAIRMMQIHLCIIYFVSGISKLQGGSWWQGTAVWAVLANYEFAPMNLPIYTEVLRFFGQNQLLFDSLITGACLFTLAFEIAYPFLIWKPTTRWLFLLGAIVLHGFIGLFMGLKTFSLMMLIFNMAFLRQGEVAAILRWCGVSSSQPPPQRSVAAKPRPAETPAPAPAGIAPSTAVRVP